MVLMDPKGNKGTTHKLSGKTLFVLTGSILCQDRQRHDSVLESARFGNLDIESEKVTFSYYISCDSYRDVCMIQCENKISLCTITFSFSKFQYFFIFHHISKVFFCYYYWYFSDFCARFLFYFNTFKYSEYFFNQSL